MLFNSLVFIVFLAVVLVIYWNLAPRARTYFLLAASYAFYANWDYRFLSLLLTSTIVDYWTARGIHASPDPRRRRLYLLASLGTNLGILGFFKYYNFFMGSFGLLLDRLGLPADLGTLSIILPVGISFYTFQTMSYTIDVYRGQVEPTDDFITFATYVAFFPQLVAGPIERFHRLFHQLERPGRGSVWFIRQGIFLILQGYVKKVAIADNIAPVVDQVFRSAATHNAGELLEAAILFTAQIYCDFSGYSDIARGVAYLLGIELTVNFRAPLLSRSITEFWRRWHVSLSQWLRDYLYIPLGGNRRGPWRTYANLMATMLLGGLWHGADWKFVVWGGLHGLLLALERFFKLFSSDDLPIASWRTLPTQAVRWILTFSAVVVIFVFFRAASMDTAWNILSRIGNLDGVASLFTPRLAYVLGTILALDVAVLVTDRQTWILGSSLPLRVGVYAAMVLSLILLTGHHNESFIYFAF